MNWGALSNHGDVAAQRKIKSLSIPRLVHLPAILTSTTRPWSRSEPFCPAAPI